MSPDQFYPVTPDQQSAYRRDGHILLRSVATQADIAAMRPLITGIVDEVSKRQDSQGRISDYGRMFTQVTNVWRKDDRVREFIFSKRLARIAADLMGVKGVRLYHDQALIKEPGGKATPWHQDFYYWPLATEHTITMWMALVDIPRSMGSMSFASGSHTGAPFKEMPISDTSQEYFERVIREQKTETPSYELKAGDATFHSGRVLHSAHANQSQQRREVITVIYYADGTTVLEPDNEHRKVDLEVFLPGVRPGETAAGDLNPLLYP